MLSPFSGQIRLLTNPVVNKSGPDIYRMVLPVNIFRLFVKKELKFTGETGRNSVSAKSPIIFN